MITLVPGSTIGIIGGGQLGRMLAIAAAQLGYRCHIYAPEHSGPAADVAPVWVQGAYDNLAALTTFANGVDVLTYEFENIPVSAIEAIAATRFIAPNAKALGIAQDRAAEKDFATAQGGVTAPWAAVDSLTDLQAALAKVGTPAILKTRRFGYDGKGQVRIMALEEAGAAWDAVKGVPCVLEGMVTFEQEFSVLVARSADGATRVWDSPRNIHKDGILALSIVPAGDVITAQRDAAAALALKIADALDYVGVLTLEFFASAAGPIFNEMAPRVHNSGHWTIEGALTSQFENHIRAICGLPLGDTDLVAPKVEMENLIGDDASRWPEFLAESGAHLHLYGKNEARPGRKMGHVTRLHLG